MKVQFAHIIKSVVKKRTNDVVTVYQQQSFLLNLTRSDSVLKPRFCAQVGKPVAKDYAYLYVGPTRGHGLVSQVSVLLSEK